MVWKVVKWFCLDNEGNRSLQELEVVTILSSTVDFKVNMNWKDCLLSFYSSWGFFELKIPEVDRVLKYRFNIETIEEKDDDWDWSEL